MQQSELIVVPEGKLPEGYKKLNVTPEELNGLDWDKWISYLTNKPEQMSNYTPLKKLLGGKVFDPKEARKKQMVQGVIIFAVNVDLLPHGSYFRVFGGHGTSDKIQHPVRGKEGRESFDYYFSSGAKWDWMLKYFGHVLDKPYNKIVNIGLIRSDPFVNGYDEKKSLENVGIEKSKPILLVAPTANSGSLDGMVRMLKKEVCKEYHVIIRPHYLEQRRFNRKDLKDHGIHLYTGGDIADVLYIADIMISDESSVMYDFAASGRPILIKQGWKISSITLPKKYTLRHRVPTYVEGSLLKALDEAKKPEYINSVKNMMEQAFLPIDGKAVQRMANWVRNKVAIKLHVKKEYFSGLSNNTGSGKSDEVRETETVCGS